MIKINDETEKERLQNELIKKDYRNYKASIGYYYPTSPGAEYFGYSEHGCFGLSFVDEKGNSDLIASFANEKEAYEYADKLNMEYDRYDLREYHKRRNAECKVAAI